MYVRAYFWLGGNGDFGSGVNLAESTFFFPLSLFLSGAVSVSSCVNQYFEVKEGETTNRLTCRGLTSQDTVNWFAKGSAAGSCPPLSPGSSSDSCTPAPGAFGKVFRPSRTSNAESVLNVDPVVYGSTVVEKGGSLECRIAGGIPAVRWIMSVSSLTAAVDGSQCLS